MHDHLDWAPPARMKVGKGLYGPHSTEPTALPAAPSWSLSTGERRQLKTAGSVVAEVKLTQNAIFGRCCMNPDKFRNTNAYVNEP